MATAVSNESIVHAYTAKLASVPLRLPHDPWNSTYSYTRKIDVEPPTPADKTNSTEEGPLIPD
jgi:hypothetical protein